ncbi:uncharacterized protein LOC133795307 [Humulus lupulus]|uniref:uncharacterized protein LOC133795307 n=1 Tax=Humulus lupulus TaxID=3486 RepID=UPI002B400DAB|nr:uncharacterized protein LOC133795307 [Humulus lupulus]
MSILSLNCRGLGNPRVIQFLKELVSQKKPSCIFLCETPCSRERVEYVRCLLGFEGGFAVDAHGRSGGIALLWHKVDEVSLLSYSSNHIDVMIRSVGPYEYRLTGIYGEPNRSLRNRTWELIRTLQMQRDSPWCLIGDFNNIISHEDKRGGLPYPNWLVQGFQDVIQECGLHDINLIGYQFTWEASRGTDRWIEVRLDRGLANQKWLDFFPLAKLFNLEVSSSDHCPLLLDPCYRQRVFLHRGFKFENAWIRELLCQQIIENSWNSCRGRSF